MPFQVPPHLLERYDRRSRVPELLLEAGRIQGEGARRSGLIWGRAVEQLGQIPGQVMEQEEQRKVSEARRKSLEEETKARQQASATQQRRSEAFAQGRTRQEILARLQGDPEGYAAATKHFQEIDDNLRRTLGSYAAAVRAAGDDPEYAFAALTDMEENGFDKQKLAPYAARMRDKAGVTAVIDTLLKGSPDEGHRSLVSKPPGTREIKVRNPDGSETIKVVEDRPGQEFTSAAMPKGPDTRSVEVQMAEAAMKGDQATYEKLLRAKRDAERAGRAPERPQLERIETVDASGKPVTRFVTPSAGAEYPKPTGAGKPATGQQRKALSFFNRAKEAQEIASSLEEGDQISPARIKYTPELLNFLQSNPNQAYQQAQRAFTEARLRKESGAAVPEQEYKNDQVTYFAQPGDSTETKAQKRTARNAVLAGIAFEAADALKEFYGEEADGMLEALKVSGKSGARNAPKGFSSENSYGYPEGTVIEGPNGQMVLRNGRWVKR